MPRKTKRGSLEAYRSKRSPGATPEPFGGEGFERPGLFVVQQHDATRMHWDLRLEIGGVMKSWAVPKGPSLDPEDKRLAVMTEDHPMEYADFEGVIPEGNYGAGAMIVWDHGRCVQRLDPDEGLAEGKLLFDLYGYKLRGRFTLVKTSRGENEWLLIKKPDGGATGETVEELGPESVFSGLTVEELGRGADREAEIETRLQALGAKRRRVDPGRVKLMLARLADTPFSDPDWLFELKYDGYRVLASLDRGDGGRPVIRLAYRSGRDATAVYPDLVRALSALPFSHLVLDGEVVVLDEEARPSFSLLQQRARLTNPRDAERASVALPAVLFCFDLLGFGDRDLRPLPLVERKELLRDVVPRAGPVRFADHLPERGEELYEQVRGVGVEGIVAKRADSPYRGGRSPHWLKVRAERTGDFAVVGYTLPQGARPGFGALHLAALHGPRLVYAGRVGSGFSEKQLEEIRARLDTSRVAEPRFDDPPPRSSAHRWVEPQLVAEVKYTEYTADDLLRHPVFVRLRTDKRIEDCTRDDVPPPQIEES
ncbi:MAG: non-homologous end-joining DNA ligase, partial [Thermoanaerobaculia bacterium]|nr:non-homologous end-joining DNA ligase [Thermoanaerobaculia bacterium]